MRPPDLLLHIVFLGSWAASSAAQTQLPGQAYWRFIPDGSSASSYHHVAAGDFTGHGYVDVAYLADQQVMLVTAPAVHTAALPIAGSLAANGLATVHGAGQNGRDALAIATHNGLVVWTRETTVAIDTRDWVSVASGDIDGDGMVDLFGRSPAGNEVLIMLGSASGYTATSIPFTNEIVRDVAAVQWDGVGGAELAIVTDGGMHVRSTATQTDLTLVRRTNLQSIGLTALRMGSGSGLAWLPQLPNGTYSLLTLRPGVAVESLPVSAMTPTSFVAGDSEGDGYDDVAIGTANSSAYTILLNQQAQPSPPATFSFAATATLDHYSAATSNNAASPWIGDFDADGVIDAVIPRRDLGGVVVKRGGDYGAASRPSMDSTQYPQPTVVGGLVNWHLEATCLAAPVEATQVELICFATNPNTSPITLAALPTLTIQPTAVLRRTVDIAPVVSSSIAFNWSEPINSAVYTFKFAMLRYRSPTRAWPPLLFAFSSTIVSQTPNDPAYDWMQLWSGNQPNWQHGGLQLISTIQYAGTSGTIKPPPPPPPPEPPVPPSDGG